VTNKPTLCLDFDGVIHSYERGWRNGIIYGSAVPGFFDWAQRATEYFHLTIYSSRSLTSNGQDSMRDWLRLEADEWCKHQQAAPSVSAVLAWFAFSVSKPKAFLTIDDRAIQFRGDWTAWWLDPTKLLEFKPWNAGGVPCEATSKPETLSTVPHIFLNASTKWSREQRLIDLMFEMVYRTTQSHAYWRPDRDAAMAWVAHHLKENGFPTTPIGLSWGMMDAVQPTEAVRGKA
jgi:hypothetical protein